MRDRTDIATTQAPNNDQGPRRKRERQRGQVLVIFALASFLFVGMCAVVVDVAWYWSSSLRVQRAADAAALAGAVLLPGRVDTGSDNAYARALSEASKNGYAVGNGVTVTPIQDSRAVAGGSPNQLDVTISAPVPTFFMRLFGIQTITATRTAKASFILPVPMGSPQNYYGVGEFLTTPLTTRTTATAGSSSGSAWSAAANSVSSDNNVYAQSATANGSAVTWRNFGLTTGTGAVASSAKIGAISVDVTSRLSGSGSSTQCRLLVALSWDGGSSWSDTLATPDLTTTETTVTLPASGESWGSHAWTPAELANAAFRIRFTWDKPNCSSGYRAQVDMLDVTVASEVATAVNDPVSGSALTPQNFWGAMFTVGGVRQNGDYFAPATLGGSASGTYNASDPSPSYDSDGYDYTVDLRTSTNGQVRLFDPVYCATGPNTTGGWYGAGDHWTTHSSGNSVIAPVAVTYRLYRDVNSTPFNRGDDTLISTLNYDPAGKTLGDFSGTVGAASSIQNDGRADALDCSAHAGHNRWVTLATGLAGGTYRLNVDTSSQAVNAAVGAENMFAIWVSGAGGNPRVHGAGRMAGYTQVGAAPQAFYLAQIDAAHAGKTLQIQLFDPGDVAGDAVLTIQSPDGNVYTNVAFSYQADAACASGVSAPCSGTNVTSIQTASGGRSSFDNSLITITVALPATYGSAGLTPAGVPGATAAARAGWWKIYYDVTNANDTTTWMVNIVGNPVHLVVP